MTDSISPCAGKRSYSGREWAMKALAKAGKKRERGRRGTLHVYNCDECGGWHLGRSHASNRPAHRREPEAERPSGPSSGALRFAEAEAIAKHRFPDGANASQLAQILREVLSAKATAA